MTTNWLVCDENVCLYAESSLSRLKANVPRCIKHGAILTYEMALRGMSRVDARRQLDEWRERAK